MRGFVCLAALSVACCVGYAACGPSAAAAAAAVDTHHTESTSGRVSLVMLATPSVCCCSSHVCPCSAPHSARIQWVDTLRDAVVRAATTVPELADDPRAPVASLAAVVVVPHAHHAQNSSLGPGVPSSECMDDARALAATTASLAAPKGALVSVSAPVLTADIGSVPGLAWSVAMATVSKSLPPLVSHVWPVSWTDTHVLSMRPPVPAVASGALTVALAGAGNHAGDGGHASGGCGGEVAAIDMGTKLLHVDVVARWPHALAALPASCAAGVAVYTARSGQPFPFRQHAAPGLEWKAAAMALAIVHGNRGAGGGRAHVATAAVDALAAHPTAAAQLARGCSRVQSVLAHASPSLLCSLWHGIAAEALSRDTTSNPSAHDAAVRLYESVSTLADLASPPGTGDAPLALALVPPRTLAWLPLVRVVALHRQRRAWQGVGAACRRLASVVVQGGPHPLTEEARAILGTAACTVPAAHATPAVTGPAATPQTAGALAVGADAAATAPLDTPAAPHAGSPLSVCVATQEFEAVGVAGGIGSALARLAHLLLRRGHRVLVILLPGWSNRLGPAARAAIGRYEEQGIRFQLLHRRHHRAAMTTRPTGPAALDWRTAWEPNDLTRYAFRLDAWLRGNAHRCDVLHYHEWLGVGYRVATAKAHGVAAYRHLRLVAQVHGPHFWALHNQRRLMGGEAVLVAAAERLSCEAADVVVSPSAYLLDLLRRHGWHLPQSRARVLLNVMRPAAAGDAAAAGGGDHSSGGQEVWTTDQSGSLGETSTASTTSTSSLQAEQVAVPVRELVFFGKTNSFKGLDIFCDAVDALLADEAAGVGPPVPDITFLVRIVGIGQANTNGKTYLEHRIAAGKWRSRISSHADDAGGGAGGDDGATGMRQVRIISGWNSTACTSYLSQRSSGRLAVMPSRLENSPTVVLECLQYGIPFVATAVGGTPELVHADDAATCLVEPTPDALARKLGVVLVHGASAARPAVAFHSARERWVELHSQLAATTGSHRGDATCGAVDGRHLVQDLAVVVALRDGALDAGAAGVHAAVEGVLGAVHSSLESIVRAVEHSTSAGAAVWSGRIPVWRTRVVVVVPTVVAASLDGPLASSALASAPGVTLQVVHAGAGSSTRDARNVGASRALDGDHGGDNGGGSDSGGGSGTTLLFMDAGDELAPAALSVLHRVFACSGASAVAAPASAADATTSDDLFVAQAHMLGCDGCALHPQPFTGFAVDAAAFRQVGGFPRLPAHSECTAYGDFWTLLRVHGLASELVVDALVRTPVDAIERNAQQTVAMDCVAAVGQVLVDAGLAAEAAMLEVAARGEGR